MNTTKQIVVEHDKSIGKYYLLKSEVVASLFALVLPATFLIPMALGFHWIILVVG